MPEKLTDDELVVFLGIKDWDRESIHRYLLSLTPESRDLFGRTREVELWDSGFGPRLKFKFLYD